MIKNLKVRNNVLIVILILSIALVSISTGMMNNKQSDDKVSVKGPYQSQYSSKNQIIINTCPATPCSGGWNAPISNSTG